MGNLTEIIYATALHRALAPAGLPESVRFLCPGLRSRVCTKLDSCFIPPALPFPPQKAEVLLRDLLDMGLTLNSAGDLKFMANPSQQEQEEAPTSVTRQEKRDLKSFAANGQPWQQPETVEESLPPNRHAQISKAQKVLLLAWEIEECLLEMRHASERVCQSARGLHFSLHQGVGKAPHTQENKRTLGNILPEMQPEHAELAALDMDERLMENFLAGGLSFSAPQNLWRAVLGAAGAFLPKKTTLISCHPGMLADLQAQELLKPLPEEMFELCAGWEKDFAAGLLWTNQPIWRILGYSRLPQDRPWLDQRHDLLVSSHDAG